MYFVIKHTQETDDNNTQVIRPHTDKIAATKDFHREIAETLEYTNVLLVLGVVLMDEYNVILDQYRYAKPIEEVMP